MELFKIDHNNWFILIFKQFWIFWLILIITILKIIPFYYPIILYFAFCIYHQLISFTEIIFTKNTKMEEIIKKSNLESFKFRPNFFFPITPLQFINLFRTKVKINHKISVIRKNIGNNGVCLDWIKYEDINNENNPILIIFPGLTGSIDDAYVINLANECIINGGFNTCIYQMRLLSDKLKVDKNYLFLIDDIYETLDEIRKEYGENKNIYGIGFSYGANQLTKYLGQKNYIKKKINVGVSICNLYEFLFSSRLGKNKIYNRMLLMFLKEVMIKTKKSLENLKIDVDSLLKTNKMKDLDDYYAAKVFGYSCGDEYYRNVSCINDIKNVNVPLLCISAKDDQISFEESIPYDDIKLNKNIALIHTSHGTHSCFIENDGIFWVKQWIPKPVVSFLKAIEND